MTESAPSSPPESYPPPNRRRGNLAQFAFCLWFEIFKTLRRALPWLGIVGAILAVVSVPLYSDRPLTAGEAWTELAEMVRRGFEFSSLILVILGASCVNCERQSSALRAYLLRPVSRSQILAAKATTLFLYTLLLATIVLALSWIIASMRFGFGSVFVEIEGLDPVLKFDRETMQSMVLRLQLMSSIPLLFFASLGLMISTIIDSEATGITLGILGRMFYGFLAEALVDSEAFSGLRSIGVNYERCAELARGIETQVQDIQSLGITHPEIAYPLASIVIFLAIGFTVFGKRELCP